MGRPAGAQLKLCVLDASVAAAWYLPSQATQLTDPLLPGAAMRSWRVPACFDYEITNLLLRYERRGALPPGMTEIARADLRALDLQSLPAPEPAEFSRAISLARRYEISLFDAFYLSMACSLHALLVTRDGLLVDAAAREHCAVEDLRASA